jgi:hypothetical protein
MEVTEIDRNVLVLAANPQSTIRLELEREAALIWERLQQGESGRKYRVHIEQGSGVEDVARYLAEYQPTVVHFVGNGSPTGEIMLRNNCQIQPLTPSDFANLFKIEGRQIDCVVLNSCFSVAMADELGKHVGCTIGIDEEIDDAPTEKSFIGEFYRELAMGNGYQGAFDRGCREMQSLQLYDRRPHFISGDRALFDRQINAPTQIVFSSIQPKLLSVNLGDRIDDGLVLENLPDPIDDELLEIEANYSPIEPMENTIVESNNISILILIGCANDEPKRIGLVSADSMEDSLLAIDRQDRSESRPFNHPYHWAAFMTQGMV